MKKKAAKGKARRRSTAQLPRIRTRLPAVKWRPLLRCVEQKLYRMDQDREIAPWQRAALRHMAGKDEDW